MFYLYNFEMLNIFVKFCKDISEDSFTTCIKMYMKTSAKTTETTSVKAFSRPL